jgi:hypothetical protein
LGIATLRKHSLITQRKRREGNRQTFIRISISNKTPQTINEKENPWGYRLGTVSGKTISHWGFKPGSCVGCTNRTIAPTGSHINKPVQVVLVK